MKLDYSMQQIPDTLGKRKAGRNQIVVTAFANSGKPLAKVVLEDGANFRNSYCGLSVACKNVGGVKCLMRGGDLYFVRIDREKEAKP